MRNTGKNRVGVCIRPAEEAQASESALCFPPEQGGIRGGQDGAPAPRRPPLGLWETKLALGSVWRHGLPPCKHVLLLNHFAVRTALLPPSPSRLLLPGEAGKHPATG